MGFQGPSSTPEANSGKTPGVLPDRRGVGGGEGVGVVSGSFSFRSQPGPSTQFQTLLPSLPFSLCSSLLKTQTRAHRARNAGGFSQVSCPMAGCLVLLATSAALPQALHPPTPSCPPYLV